MPARPYLSKLGVAGSHLLRKTPVAPLGSGLGKLVLGYRAVPGQSGQVAHAREGSLAAQSAQIAGAHEAPLPYRRPISYISLRRGNLTTRLQHDTD